jgi:hypothetical protein
LRLINAIRQPLVMSNNDSSDDDDPLICRALEDSKAAFAAEQERRKSWGGSFRNNEAMSGNNDEVLEVLAPSTIVKKEKSTKPESPNPRSLRLSASGVAPHDPVDLAFDASQSDSDREMPLKERLLARRASSVAVTSSMNVEPKAGVWRLNESNRSDVSLLKPPPPASLPNRTTQNSIFGSTSRTAKPQAEVPIAGFDSSSESDDSFHAATAALDLVSNVKKANHSVQSALSSDTSTSSNSEDARRNRKPSARGTKLSASRSATAEITEKKRKESAKERQERLEAKQRERQRNRAAKEHEKLQRQEERKAKLAAAEEEKESRKRRRENAANAGGKHAKDEIAVLMERDLFRNQNGIALVHALQKAGFRVLEYPSALGCNAVQFIRKDYSEGGAEIAIEMLLARNQNGYAHLPIVVIVFDVPNDFIRLLERSDHEDDDDYPNLIEWLRGVEAGWRAAWKLAANQRPRIILVLEKVLESIDKRWIEYRKRGHGDTQAPPTAEELHDAVTWMLIEFQVECVHCASSDDVSNDLRKMTRLLAEEPYQRQVTDLDCIRKLKPQCSDMDSPDARSTDCWRRQLQQVPSVSFKVASSLVEFYPTARSLWTAYQNDTLSESEKRLLLADCCGTGRRHAKLSDQIYRILTSLDPDDFF